MEDGAGVVGFFVVSGAEFASQAFGGRMLGLEVAKEREGFVEFALLEEFVCFRESIGRRLGLRIEE
jgi:hypothetical protein